MKKSFLDTNKPRSAGAGHSAAPRRLAALAMLGGAALTALPLLPAGAAETIVGRAPVTLPVTKTAPGGPGGGPAGTATPPTGSYSFTLNSFRITDTRAPHNDTDFVSIAVAVGNNPPITVPVKSMGDVNNGDHPVGLSIPNITVGANQPVAFTYSIVNKGFSNDSFEQALIKIVEAAATKGVQALGSVVGGSVGGALGSLVGTQATPWIDELANIVFADCDGPVAAGDHIYSGAQLAAQTANGFGFSATDFNAGSNSPTGCFGNSKYYVTWSISPSSDAGNGRVIGRGTGGGSGTHLQLDAKRHVTKVASHHGKESPAGTVKTSQN